MNRIKNISIRAAIVLTLAAWISTVALSGVFAADEYNINKDGLAIHGFDPVAYFSSGQPQEGSGTYEYKYHGMTYRFVSAANRDAFMADPAKYSPAFGGYCSYGVVVGKKFDVDPNAWKIVDGVLYLQLDLGTRAIWEKQEAMNIEVANRLWPSLKSMPIDKL